MSFCAFVLILWNSFIWIIPHLFISPFISGLIFFWKIFMSSRLGVAHVDYDHGLTTQQPRYHNLWRFIEAVTTTSTTGESTTASINVLARTSRQRKRESSTFASIQLFDDQSVNQALWLNKSSLSASNNELAAYFHWSAYSTTGKTFNIFGSSNHRYLHRFE